MSAGPANLRRGSGGAPFIHFATALAMLVAFLAVAPDADAGSVEFDVPKAVVAVELAPETLGLDPQTRIVEMTVLVSTRFRRLQPDEVQQLEIEITARDPALQVFAYLPTTQLASELIGEIQTTKTVEEDRSLSATLGGAVPLPIGDLIAQVTPSATARESNREVVTETTKRLPPKQAVVVSGTAARGRGAFFTLRPSSQSTLEGAHPFTLRFAVPEDWRTGQLEVTCRATGKQNWLWLQRDKVWGKATVTTEVVLDGDPVAHLEAQQREAHTTNHPSLPGYDAARRRKPCPCRPQAREEGT